VARPQDGYAFVRGRVSMTGRDYVSSTADQTLANLSLWVASNVRHGWGTPELPYTQDLAGRLHRSLDWGHLWIVGGIGCHTTRDLLVDLARAVNIPVLPALMPSRARPPFVTSIGHGAAAYRWDSPAVRILEHADDLNANSLYPDAGFRWTDESEEHARCFFEVTWPTAAELGSFGFVVDPTFHRLWAGTGEVELDDGSPRIAQQAHRWYGRVVGVWPDNDESAGSELGRMYLADRGSRLGSQRGYVRGGRGIAPPIDRYCSSRSPDGALGDLLLDDMVMSYPTLARSRDEARAVLLS
jgi:hypothetical protein